MMSSAPCAAAPAMMAGTSVLWPAASVLTPTACTSFSIAWRAHSSGVWNSGPMSTSKPRSANAVATTLAPRSWPSWPSLAIITRGRRPCSAAKCGDLGLQLGPSPRRCRRRLRTRRSPSGCRRGGARKTFSSASLTSPTVARRRIGVDAQRQQVALPDVRRGGQRVERRRTFARVARALIACRPGDLALAHLDVVDLADLDAVLVCRACTC
jgi:hypothetical protein